MLEWHAHLAGDPDGRKYLWAWARGTCSSFAELCREMGWKQSVAERGRQRASAALAATLNDVFAAATRIALDSGEARAAAGCPR